MIKKISVLFIAVAMAVAFSGTAKAAFIDGGLFTTDTDTSLDWKDLTETNGYSYNYVSTQFGAGGAYEGWRYATLSEFQVMIVKFGFTIGNTFEFPVSDLTKTAINDFTLLFGNTMGEWYPRYYHGALGIVDYNTAVSEPFEHYRVGAFARLTEGLFTNVTVQTTERVLELDTNGQVYLGHYLVKASASVPEPSTLLLLGSGLVGFGFVRRRLKR